MGVLNGGQLAPRLAHLRRRRPALEGDRGRCGRDGIGAHIELEGEPRVARLSSAERRRDFGTARTCCSCTQLSFPARDRPSVSYCLRCSERVSSLFSIRMALVIGLSGPLFFLSSPPSPPPPLVACGSSLEQPCVPVCAQTEIIESFAGNLQRIDKDVRRCDRHVPFFSEQRNLDKLRNVVCTYAYYSLYSSLLVSRLQPVGCSCSTLVLLAADCFLIAACLLLRLLIYSVTVITLSAALRTRNPLITLVNSHFNCAMDFSRCIFTIYYN